MRVAKSPFHFGRRARSLVALAIFSLEALLVAPAATARDAFVARLTPINTPTVFYFHSHVVDCQGVSGIHLARRATVVVPERPAHGEITIREGQAPVRHCQGRAGYATIVTYTPERNFTGVDAFRLSILFELSHHTVLRHVNARVQVGGLGNRH